MERIVGEMEDEETEGNAIEGMESGDWQQGREQEVDGEDQDDKEEESETTAVEHAEVEAQVHRGKTEATANDVYNRKYAF